MNCPDLELLEQHAREELPAARRTLVGEHLLGCLACQERLALVQDNLRVARRVAEQSATDTPPDSDDISPTTLAAAIESTPKSGSSTSAAPPAFPGYQIVREISRGGQGVVYQAIQQSTRPKVAIKVLREGHFADSSERARFEREVQILGQLKHPNVVSIYDSGSVGGNAFYVMDYISGKPLDEFVRARHPEDAKTPGVVRRGRLNETLALFAKICAAVHEAHLKGIIHRDLKPSNIRVDSNGEPHVLDFGLAKVVGAAELSSSPVMTMTGQFLGSVPWSSPEQAEGQPSKIDIRTDVYSLGIVLYQLLTGRYPYDVTGNMRDVLDRIMHAEPLPPHSLSAPVDDEVATIVLKCLAKERDRRYQSAGELARDIGHYLAGEPIEAKRDSVGYLLRKRLQRHKFPLAVALGFAALMSAASVAVSLVVAVGFVVVVGAAGVALCGLYVRQRRETARAEAALVDAERRQMETQQVVDFQVAQLREIDVPGMSVRLRRLVLDESAAAIRRDSPSFGEIQERQAQFEGLLSNLNLTNVALKQLDRDIFERTLAAARARFDGQPLVKARLLQILAETVHGLGLLERAHSAQQEALDIRRRTLGDDHPDTLTSMHQMGDLLQSQGKLPEAEAHMRDVLERRRRLLGDEHPDTLNALEDVADVLSIQGNQSEAEPLCREALAKRRRVLGDEHPGTLASLNALGFLLKEQGKLAEAADFLGQALAKRRRVLGDGHPETLRSLNAMGRVLQERGNLTGAEACYREALEKRRRLLGDGHPLTLNSINWLGSVLIAEGKLQEAEPLCREALESRRRLLGDDHPDTLTSVSNLGALHMSARRLTEAEVCFREALAGRRRTLGNDHRDTLDSLLEMGGVLWAQGNLVEAEPCAQDALAAARRILGDNHPSTLKAMADVGFLIQSRGKLADSEVYLRESYQAHRRVLGDDHPETQNAINTLAFLLQAQGRLDEAAQHYRGVLETNRRILGEDHPTTVSVMGLLGHVLESQGKLSEAEPYTRAALEHRRRLLGDDDRGTLVSISNMGALLLAQEKGAEAVALLAPAEAAVRREFVGSNRFRLARYLVALGRSRTATEAFQAAKSNLDEAFALLDEARGPLPKDYVDSICGMVELYDAWHFAEPDKGYDRNFVEWRTKLAELQAGTQPGGGVRLVARNA